VKQEENIMRALGGMEYVYWLMDLSSRTNFIVIAELSGQFPFNIIQTALDIVQKSNPFLKVEINQDKNNMPVFRYTDRKINVRIIEQFKNIAPELEREHLKRFNPGDGPLMRIVVLKKNNEDTLFFTFHHSICDATSAIQIVNKVLEAAGALIEKKTIEFKKIELSNPVEDYIPAEFLKIKGFVGFMKTSIRLKMSGKVFHIPLDRVIKPYERQDRFITRELNEKITEMLIDRAKKENTTVYGALSSAQILAQAYEQESNHELSMNQISLLSLRKRLPIIVDDNVPGPFISFVESIHRISPKISLWDLARDIRSSLQKDLDANIHFSYFSWMTRLIKKMHFFLTPDEFGSKKMLVLGEKSRPSGSAISNIGKINIPEEYGSISLKSLHFVMSLSGSAFFGSTVTGFRGRTFWNFSYSHPSVSFERAKRVSDRAIEIISKGIM